MKPLITVLFLVSGDHAENIRSSESLAAQTYGPLEVIELSNSETFDSIFETNTHFLRDMTTKRIIIEGATTSTLLNEGLKAASGKYISIIEAGDVYSADRIERLYAEIKSADGKLAISYVSPLNSDRSDVPRQHGLRRGYEHILISEIASLPSLSFASVLADVAYCPGNLFFRKDLVSTIGPFREYKNLFYMDFYLRSCLIAEPTLVRARLLKHVKLFDLDADEHTAVLSEYIKSIYNTPPANRLADVFRSHTYKLGITRWSKTLNDAMNNLIETRRRDHVMSAPEPVFATPAISDTSKTYTLVSHELSLTGAPVIVLELASLMRGRGLRTKVYTQEDGPLREVFEKRGIEVQNAGGTGIGFLDRSLKTMTRKRTFSERLLRSIAKRVRKLRRLTSPNIVSSDSKDVLLINSVASWPTASPLVDRWKGPMYWYVHESLDPEWIMPEKEADKFRLLSSSGRLKIIYGSEATRAYWAANGFKGRVSYWSGIGKEDAPVEKIYASRRGSKDKRTILNVGMVGARKGSRALLEAFAIGRTEGLIPDDVELCIIGCSDPATNPEMQDLMNRSLEPDICGKVRLIGNLLPAEIPAYYQAADVYVHASIFDCMPIALLTAMSYGLPIVTTDVDGCKEAILNAESGLLVKPRSPRQMAEAIGALFNDGDLALRLGLNARERFSNVFAVEATFDSLLEKISETHGSPSGWGSSDPEGLFERDNHAPTNKASAGRLLT
jgi:glycosyltransferase involved in cell wall biosynthesis